MPAGASCSSIVTRWRSGAARRNAASCTAPSSPNADFSNSTASYRNPIGGLQLSSVANQAMTFTMTIVETGGVYEVDARAPLEKLEAALGEHLAPGELDEEIDTVGGLVSALAGRVPQRGEVIAHPAGFEIQVLDSDARRVKRVRFAPVAAPSGEEV